MIISPEDYMRLIDEINDALLEAEALRTMVDFNEESTSLLSHHQILEEFGLSDDALADSSSAEIE